MKRTTVIFLLLIFLFNTMGYFVVFKISQVQIKKAIRADFAKGILNKKVIVMNLGRSDIQKLHWLKKDEFEFRSERYDILKMTKNKDSVTIFCIHDKKETQLFNKLAEHIKEHVNSSKSSQKSASKSFADHNKIIDTNIFSIDPSFKLLEPVKFQPLVLNYSFSLILAKFQPPEFIS